MLIPAPLRFARHLGPQSLDRRTWHGVVHIVFTIEVCSIGHVSLKISDRGVRQIELHLHRIADGAHHGYVTEREGAASIVLRF